MQSPFYFIVKPREGKRYNNTKEIGGIDLIINTSEEDFRFSNREADVVELPIGYEGPIKVGHKLLVHHNVFKFYNDMKGRRKSGKSFFKEDLFFIDDEQFFMFHNGTDWQAHDRYCFVKPIKPEESFIYKPIEEEPLMGIMVYPNEYLMSKGVKPGDKICFKPDSEYEFIVDEEKLYRIYDHQITIKL
jgi:hypothetical protein